MAKKKTYNQLNTGNSFEIYTYEQYLVAEILRRSNKGYEISSRWEVDGFVYPPDLYAPDGIPSLGLDGKTIIEVKSSLSFAMLKEVDVLYKTYGGHYNILVVFWSKTVSKIPKDKSELGKSLKFLSFSDLRKGRSSSVKSEKSFYAAKNKRRTWIEEREDVVKIAQEIVKQDNNVLFLGAGVSMSAKMPSWNELLKGLMGEVKQLKPDTLTAFKELSTHVFDECGDSNLIMGRYLQTAIRLYDDKAEFSELIQRYLYNENNTSDLLKTLAHIIRHKKVNEVITYNFDDLLEENLDVLKLVNSVDYASISKDAEIKGHNTLPIYHVHGIIPRTGPVDTVVFSEEEYHSRYSNVFHWSNVEQLHALSRMHCFFVGLSMNDPNLRRLLDAARRMNESNGECHFAFLKRTQLEKYCVTDAERSCKYVHVSDSLIDKKKQKEIYDLNYSVLESIFMELGVRVIWYEDHKELPVLVAKVFGLTEYENREAKELISTCENLIDDIKKFEDDFFMKDYSKLGTMELMKLFSHATSRSKKYKEEIIDVNDILNELSNRIKWDEVKMQTILEMQKHVPNFEENISGYGKFYKIWLEMVKKAFN